MKKFIALVFIGVLVGLTMRIANSESLSEWLTKPGGSPPVITHWYASEKLHQGDIWKIYVEAKDPDGDMRQFVCVFDQLGYGYHTPDLVIIKKRHRGEMRGYLRFFSDLSLPEWTQVTVTIFIRDKGANKSNKVVLPLEFSLGSKQEPPPPPFDAGPLDDLGWITVDLLDPDRDSAREKLFRWIW
jgi:hypothetical protein